MADIKVSQLNDGVVDSSSYLLESNTGVSYKVKASDIGSFVNTSQADYLLNTTANTIVGAINENVAYDNSTSGLSATTKQGAIDELFVSSSNTPTSIYGTYTFHKMGAIKMFSVTSPKGLTAGDWTVLDFTVPEAYRPKAVDVSFDYRIPSSNDTIRVKIDTSGLIQIYNYTSNTGTLNIIGVNCYI